MAAPTGHARKRQYQPSLDSYFKRNVDPTACAGSISPMSPPLPADTQASLLSVGMRVRKSVPEGYKTHKTLGSPGFLSINSAPPASSAPPAPGLRTDDTRELLPFCGLHKTGGLAAQEVPSSSAPVDMGRTFATIEDDVPGLSLSQATAFSSTSSFPSSTQSSKKRSYEDEIEDEIDGFFDDDDMDDNQQELHEQSQAFRPIAQLKASTLRKENGGIGVRIMDGNGFEEATFLAPMDVDR